MRLCSMKRLRLQETRLPVLLSAYLHHRRPKGQLKPKDLIQLV